jgi:hypothetical protein
MSFELLSIIPDFLIIVWLQLIVVVIYKRTGAHVAKVGSVSVDDDAVAWFLPSVERTGIQVPRSIQQTPASVMRVLRTSSG